MVNFRSLACDDEARRAQLLAHTDLNGIDYIEVVTTPAVDNQRVLKVFFLDKDSRAALLAALHGDREKVTIAGGVRVRNIRVTEVAAVGDHLVVRVDRPGDFSTYTLRIEHSSLDPPYATCDFNFKVGCPSRFDCRPDVVCPPEPLPDLPIDYMAKDYASFRRALLDLIPTLAPQWQERLAADLGITLVELLAYAGDYLSYYQDAVANEAWLPTARQRISVRRHAKLIDYRMHDGASARTAVFIETNSPGRLPCGTRLLSRITEPLEGRQPPHEPVLPATLAEPAIAVAGTVFETMQTVHVHPDVNEMEIYDWGNRECCLPRGTTTLDLIGDLAEVIRENVVEHGSGMLLLEEVMGPKTGLKADADPRHRQLVTVTGIESVSDNLQEPPLKLTRIHWHSADELTFPLRVSARTDQGALEARLSVVRGNLVLADHGRTLHGEQHAGPLKPRHPRQRRTHRIQLREGPLSFSVRLPADNGEAVPAVDLLATDPRAALPAVTRMEVSGTLDGWKAVPDLLDSERFSQHVAVETDNRGRAHLRFGDDQFGMSPPDGSRIEVDYRVGVGSAGNVGHGALRHVINPGTEDDWPGIDDITNPVPARGGVDPESVERVRRLAPPSFHAMQFRAVTEADYAEVARRHPEVDHAVATFRWTGSWHTVFINIDPVGRTLLEDEDAGDDRTLSGRVRNWVAGLTQAQYDLEIDPPVYVPLVLEIDICVDREHFRPDVEEVLLRVLSNQKFADGARGLFHPDNFTFAQPFYLSRLFSTVESVEGVDSAVVRRFIRQDQDDPDPLRPATRKNLDRGYIPAGRLEVIRLDNDPNFLENGVLSLNMLGGK